MNNKNDKNLFEIFSAFEINLINQINTDLFHIYNRRYYPIISNSIHNRMKAHHFFMNFIEAKPLIDNDIPEFRTTLKSICEHTFTVLSTKAIDDKIVFKIRLLENLQALIRLLQ